VAASESRGGDEGALHNRESPERAEGTVRCEESENGYCSNADARAHLPEASLEWRDVHANARAV